MSHEGLHGLFAFRLGRIHHSRALIGDCLTAAGRGSTPSERDIAAITWWLGGVYNEMEEVLKGIAAAFADAVPPSTTWHRDLLEQMTAKTHRRAAVLSPALREQLDALRAFRHFSRNATALDPDWQRMQPLVAGLETTAGEFEREVREFLAKH